MEKKLQTERSRKLKYLGVFGVLGVLCTISFIISATLIGVRDYPTVITAQGSDGNPRAA